MSGGYKLIDLKDTNIPISGDGVKVKGIYNEIESNYRKAVMVTGLTIGGVECSDRWLNFRVLDGAYVGLLGFNDAYLHLLLKVEADDTVSIFEE